MSALNGDLNTSSLFFDFSRGKTIHPALSEPTQFVDWEFKAEERLALEDLEKLLNAHDEASTGPKYRECKWATVFDAMFQARTKYEGDGHAARRDAALFGLNLASEVVEAIPEDWGLGVLRGGMALLLKVAKCNLEIKTKILKLFQDISWKMTTISMAFDKLGAEQEQLQRQREFFCTVVRDMPVLIRRLLGKEKYTADIILERWKANITELNEHMERSKIASMGDIKSNANLLPDMQSSIEASKQSVGKLTDQMTELPQVMQRALQGFYDRFAETLRSKDKLERGGCLVDISQENRHLRELSRSPRPGWHYAANTNTNTRNTTPAITHMELIGALGIHVYAHMKVLEDVLHQSSNFDVPSLRQVRGLIRHSEFDHWLKTESSSLLFVECFLQDCSPTVTAASVFSSSLICTLSTQSDVIPLFFFARVDGSSRHHGPTYMMRSLLFQLLMSTALPHLDLGFISMDLFEACAQQNLSALCELFVELVCQVPPSTKVCCILEGLELYETREFLWDIQVDYIADMFGALASRLEEGEEGDGAVLNVLIMIPDRSRRLCKRVWRRESPWSCIELMREMEFADGF
ncbi:hypothetical protein BBK36DRAFT_1171816 [Trichoderma citrinoviride]|uniref:Nephrocystin 3-like N-terminal domain-containing protein n=1 Tax=Trichoderma citrinoviride TaxID=58853 RepID=A0A2T4B1B8_9HYPO|nr:hypothetical protein BBK36DRAFT_1171816 [Trichoderma citrinoviride]PTB63011.1 hypothetical protein BBK36DRAFT_1171816 [Trichoderma citrinoviride]